MATHPNRARRFMFEVRYTSSSQRSAGDAVYHSKAQATMAFMAACKPLLFEEEASVYLTRYQRGPDGEIASHLLAFKGRDATVTFEPAWFD